MVREFAVEDLDQILEITNKEQRTFESSAIMELQEISKIFIVWEDGGIKGFAYAIETNKEERKWSIQLYVEPNERRKGIGSLLYQEIEKCIEDERPSVIVSEARVDLDDPSSFYLKLCYKKWYGTTEMHYRGASQPTVDMEFINYEDKYYEQYMKCRQDCFYELRKDNDIQPYIVPLSEEDRKIILSEKEYIYIAFDDNNLIGAITIKDGYLDRIIVSPSYQGKGFGKKITQFGINQTIREGKSAVQLSCIEGNKIAEKLYKSLGFETGEVTYVYRKFKDN